MNDEILKYLRIVLENIKADIEKLLKGELTYHNYSDRCITIKLENNQSILVDFKNKPKFKNITGSAIMQINSFKAGQINYLQSLYNQYSSVNHTINIVSKKDYKPIVNKDNTGGDQMSLYDYEESLPSL